MSLFRRFRRHVASLALTALLVHLLAPTLAFARSSGPAGADGWIEVCTSLGHTRWVPASALSDADRAAATQGSSQSAAKAAGACAFCAGHGGVAPLRQVDAAARAAQIDAAPVPAQRADQLDLQQAWTAAHTRGPPRS